VQDLKQDSEGRCPAPHKITLMRPPQNIFSNTLEVKAFYVKTQYGAGWFSKWAML